MWRGHPSVFGTRTLRRPKMKPSISPSGGRFFVVSYEMMAGVGAIVLAAAATATGQDVAVWYAAAAGLAGIFGAYAFVNPDKTSGAQKVVTVLIGSGMASLLGPVVARWAAYQWPWVGSVDYFVTAAAGALVGLLCTPVLRFVHNPGPLLGFLPVVGGLFRKTKE